MSLTDEIEEVEALNLSPIQTELIETVGYIRSALRSSFPEYVIDDVIHPNLNLADKSNRRIQICLDEDKIDLILGRDSAVFFIISNDNQDIDIDHDHQLVKQGKGLMIDHGNISLCNLLKKFDLNITQPNAFTFENYVTTDEHIDNSCKYILYLLNNERSELTFRGY